MPAAIAHLEKLGVDDIDGVDFVGIRYLDALDPRCVATGDFRRPGKGVRRIELQRRLWQRARAVGVELIRGRVDGVVDLGDSVEAGGERARYLVATDGLHSQIRRQLGVGLEPRRAPRFGVRRHFEIAPWTDRVEVYWSPHGEAYVTPVGAKMVGVALLATGGGRFEELLPDYPHLVARLDGAAFATTARGGGPFEQRVSRRQVGRVLLAGDAAGYLDPITGEGVALGVATAGAAVEAIADGQPARYEEVYRKLTREYYGLTSVLLQVARRRWAHRPMIGLLQRAPWLFDRCVQLQAAGARGRDATKRSPSSPIRSTQSGWG
jgi:flavin-dependent dehydrogenase